MHEVTRVFLYGLLAAVSPTVLLATLVVLGGGRGRVNGTVFTIAFVLGTAVAFTVGLFAAGKVTHTSRDGWDLATALELAAGVALLAIAFRERPPHEPQKSSSAAMDARFEKLARVKPAISFGIGLPLGIGAKRLTITLLAAATVSLGRLTPAQAASLGVLYVVVASLIVWVPVAVYLLLGTRADDLVARARTWIATNDRMLTFVSVLVLGVLLIGDGLLKVLVG
jgi:MFS family permease